MNALPWKKVGARTLSAWLLLLVLSVFLYRPRILKKNPREIWKKFPGDAHTPKFHTDFGGTRGNMSFSATVGDKMKPGWC